MKNLITEFIWNVIWKGDVLGYPNKILALPAANTAQEDSLTDFFLPLLSSCAFPWIHMDAENRWHCPSGWYLINSLKRDGLLLTKLIYFNWQIKMIYIYYV